MAALPLLGAARKVWVQAVVGGQAGDPELEYLDLGRVGGGLAWGCPGMGTRHSLELTLVGLG